MISKTVVSELTFDVLFGWAGHFNVRFAEQTSPPIVLVLPDSDSDLDDVSVAHGDFPLPIKFLMVNADDLAKRGQSAPVYAVRVSDYDVDRLTSADMGLVKPGDVVHCHPSDVV